MTVGGFFAYRILLALPPRISTSKELTISNTAFAGLVDLFKSAKTSLVRTFSSSIKKSTTLNATSESRSALRISEVISSMSLDFNRPLLRREAKAPWNFADKDSNMGGGY